MRSLHTILGIAQRWSRRTKEVVVVYGIYLSGALQPSIDPTETLARPSDGQAMDYSARLESASPPRATTRIHVHEITRYQNGERIHAVKTHGAPRYLPAP